MKFSWLVMAHDSSQNSHQQKEILLSSFISVILFIEEAFLVSTTLGQKFS